MSRVVLALVASALAASVSLPAPAAPAKANLGIPIAPNSGMKSLHQWGGIDDAFAVNPDADESAPAPQKGAPDAMAQNQGDQDQDGDDDPDSDHFDEVLPI